MCLGEGVQPATSKGEFYRSVLQCMLVAQLVVVACNFVAFSQFLREAVFGLLLTLLLYLAQNQLSYQVLLIVIFISIYFATEFLVFALTFAQQQTNFSQLTTMQRF